MIPLSECQQDLKDTERDIANLEAIVEHLTDFIHNSGGENRVHWKDTLFTFGGTLAAGRRLRDRIKAEIALIEAEKKPVT